jgi:putative protein kinase ArgK-like GTPase of G3E family
VNKSDIEGSTTLYLTLLDLIGELPRKPLIFKVSAHSGEGLEELSKKLINLIKSDDWTSKKKIKEREDLKTELKLMVIDEVKEKSLQLLDSKSLQIDKLVDSMLDKSKDPYSAAEELSLLIFSSK